MTDAGEDEDGVREVTAYEWVLAEVDRRTDPADPWLTRSHIRAYASEAGREWEVIDTAIDAAIDNDDLFAWQGMVAAMDREVLTGIIEAERSSDFTRRILIGKCNRAIRRLKR